MQFPKKIEFFYLELIFYIFEFFWFTNIKINFKKIKNIYYFNLFLNKKHFKKLFEKLTLFKKQINIIFF